MSGACHTTRGTLCCMKTYSIADSVVAHALRRVRAARRAPHRCARAAAGVSRARKQKAHRIRTLHTTLCSYTFSC